MQASTLITPRLAEEAINSRLTCLPIESLPLAQCVGGTLRENIYAERDQPPFDRVTMDGIAVDSESLRRGLRRFRIQATQSAGRPALKLRPAEDAIEVMTGAVLPLASDCVIPVEQYEVADGIASLKSRSFDALSQRASPRQRRPSGRTAFAGRNAAARSGDRGGRFGRHGARAGEQPTRRHGRFHRRRTHRAGRSHRDYQVRRSNAYAVAAALRSAASRGSATITADDEECCSERLALHLTTHEVADPERRRLHG